MSEKKIFFQQNTSETICVSDRVFEKKYWKWEWTALECQMSSLILQPARDVNYHCQTVNSVASLTFIASNFGTCTNVNNIWFQSQEFNFTSSCWSPTRPGVFYTSDLHGHVDVWDLLSEHFSPSLRVKVSNTAIRNISAHSSGSLLACGADNGELIVLSVSDSLVTVLYPHCIQYLQFIIVEAEERKRNLFRSVWARK